MLHDLTYGSRIGFTGARSGFISPNLRSAREHPEVISSSLRKELQLGRIAGPYKNPPHPALRCSGLGVVPKKTGGHRTIMHLSAPLGGSVNDGITKEDFSLHYTTIDDAVKLVLRHGRGALMCKVDLKSAFRLLPVHPDDWPLLGCFWEGYYYIDKCLPFGLRSAPAIFNRLADALEFILRTNHGVEDILHYLDDYFFTGPPAPNPRISSAARQMTSVLSVLAHLNVPVADDKVLGPSTEIPMLGILLDSIRCEMRLPEDKLTDLREEIRTWSRRASCTKRQLLSFIGKLSFAAKVVPPGRTFVRRLLDCAKACTELDGTLPIDQNTHLDIEWWASFLPDWNGRSFFHEASWTKSPDMELYTDASGLGYGAIYNKSFLFGEWSQEQQNRSITWRELYPIILACEAWGKDWARRRILFHCDNLAVVTICRTGTSKCPYVMDLVRRLFFVAARHNFIVFLSHVPGLSNTAADSLSRLQVQKFRQLMPDADKLATPHPHPHAQ